MLPYYPALRFKQGEYVASSKLARDIKCQVQPRFIIPPPKDVDPEKGRLLTPDEIAYLTGERIGKHWPHLPAFLDAHFVAKLLGEDGLVRLFEVAQSRNAQLIPTANIKDLFNPIYRRFLGNSCPKVGVYLPYERIDLTLLMEGVRAIGCRSEDCVLFVDFTGAPFEVEGVAGSVAGIFDELGAASRWHRIVFQGSAFPKTNPMKGEGHIVVPRYEWQVFLSAINECSVPPDVLGFGDFGADCGKINFSPKASGGNPIRHLRYTTADSIVVVRGSDTGLQGAAMRADCQWLVESEDYTGQHFSYADDMIWRVSRGLSSGGTPSMWRELNMAHHMTKIVRDLGAMEGVVFADVPISTEQEQIELLFDEK
jgi:hypothetical protein